MPIKKVNINTLSNKINEFNIYSSKKVFFKTHEINGRPDGGCVDADGCYWMAGVSGWELVRITPTGKIDMIIRM